MGEAGLEPPSNSPGNTGIPQAGGAESGALAAPKPPSDPDLRAVVEAWPELPDAVRVAVVALVKAVKP